MKDRAGTALLTEREKTLLRLLAAGHTVKSAAAIIAASENAAAELLRSARRKMGVGSSREAARLLAVAEQGPQETGNDFFGVPQAKPISHERVKPWKTGTAAMATAIGIGIFGAAALLTGYFDTGSATAAPPRVIKASPSNSAVIEPGPFTLSVTFDREMEPSGYSFATGPESRFPSCDGRVRASADRRTFSMRCRAEASGRYVVWANHGRFMNFRAVDGTPARPMRIAFAVTQR